ncbi:MAG: hypothetical protein SFX18_14655 [Pirellulales bacterium]|nr:hypothetical protein [Pirellulales bacterium]
MRLLSDTSPEAERVQIELIRKKSPQERFELMARLTDEIIGIGKQAISRQYPHLSPQEVNYRFVSRNYGAEMARQFKIADEERAHERTKHHSAGT